MAWRESQKFGRRFLDQVRKRYRIAAVMSGNIDYWQDESLRHACASAGLPFLVLSKEHQTIPVVYSRSVEYYKRFGFQYTGTAVAVFGTRTKEMLIESGACSADQVWVTGPPRLDQWRDIEQSKVPKDTITLLSYADETYLAPENFVEVLTLFADAATRHEAAGVRFVVKCKNTIDRERIAERLRKYGEHRLELTVKTPLFELLPRSRLVIGYNSLAMLEALFSNAVLAVPQWSDARRDISDQNIGPDCPESRAVYRFVESPDELCQLIDQVTSRFDFMPDRGQRFSLLNRYFHVSGDETSSSIVEQFALNYVSNRDHGESDKLTLLSSESASPSARLTISH